MRSAIHKLSTVSFRELCTFSKNIADAVKSQLLVTEPLNGGHICEILFLHFLSKTKEGWVGDDMTRGGTGE